MPASPVEPAVQSPIGARNEQQRQESSCQDRSVIVSLDAGHRQELRKIKRLVAMFRLWGSKSELQMTPLENHLRHHQHHQAHQQQQQMTPPVNTTISLSHEPSERIGDSSEAPVQRLWQSLVVPLVLGCVIFLLAVWTRQISLLVVNDAIVMVLILGSVFIVMSGVAFWLAQEQQQQSNGDSDLANATTLGLSADNHTYQHLQHHHHCPHHRHHQHHHHHHPYEHHLRHHSNLLHHQFHLNQQHNTQRNDQNSHNNGNEELTKCCSIAFIDLQPPDYYSALRDSLPVVTPSLAAAEEANGGSNGGGATSASNNLAEPPSYDELASHQLDYSDQMQR